MADWFNFGVVIDVTAYHGSILFCHILEHRAVFNALIAATVALRYNPLLPTIASTAQSITPALRDSISVQSVGSLFFLQRL
jgi:hypothetical protein